MYNSTEELTRCLCCGSRALMEYLSLGMQPPPNDFLSYEDDPVCKFPLEINVCKQCYHSQLNEVVSPDLLFKNYPYRTGVSETLRNHYAELASEALSLRQIKKPHAEVLDIGCNDGTLLGYFKQLGCMTTGIDPGVASGKSAGVDYYVNDYWNNGIVHKMSWNECFDIICATNVLAHTSAPRNFLYTCGLALRPNGLIVLEFPYASSLIDSCEFDTIYHEHISYFLVNSFVRLLEGTKLRIERIEKVGIHGGSLRVFLNKGYQRDALNTVKLIEEEKEKGLLGRDLYRQFQCNVDYVCNQLEHMLDAIANSGRTVVGFGASGKGTVLLNYASDIELDYIIDETPAKIGKYSPGRRVPIKPIETLLQDGRPLDHLIMSWNCLEESLQKIKTQRRCCMSDAYITYVPTLERKMLFS